MATSEEIGADIIAACRGMEDLGINQGTSGNISVRFKDAMLITPSGVPYDAMTPDMIVTLPMANPNARDGALKPSSEWRFHHAILAARPEINVVVHAHPVHCTALAMARKGIPAAHYMVAAFGGADVRCAGYATFGTEALSDLAVVALKDRTGCLLANHGAITLGQTLDKAMWRMVELETLAHQYAVSLTLGGPVVLSDEAIAETLAKFENYGLREE